MQDLFQIGDVIVSREECLPGIRQGATYTVTGVVRSSIWFKDDDGHGRIRPAERYVLADRDAMAARMAAKAAPEPEAPVTVAFKGWGAWA